MRVFGITGWKNCGKTGLMERLVAELTSRGLRVATVKHAHHGMDVDQPGRDSYRHRAAGAGEVLVASPLRWALMHELRGAEEPALEALLARLGPTDLVLVEGYKSAGHPKIEAHRSVAGQGLIAEGNATIRAVASDMPVPGVPLPVFDLDDTVAIADFVLTEVGLAVAQAAPLAPRPLKNDCFALPKGVNWVPVDTALARLRDAVAPVTGAELAPVAAALGRVLAVDAVARRSNPPAANSAVDGYGFAGGARGAVQLPLVAGRAAAGAPFAGAVPPGHAVRILTGAILPEGVDTVVLEEDVATDGATVALGGPLKRGANARKAGEDIAAGQVALAAGRVIGAQDLALLSALGIAEVTLRRPLRVGVLSTGDELLPDPTVAAAGPHQIHDANRPMLLSLAARWGCQPVDLGHAPDDPGEIAARLDAGAERADVILTSGGASAGDEDHVSRLLRDQGELSSWRIAIKPGRPLALAMWRGMPVFGLPGNPVAAFVCALIFARPTLSALAGAGWTEPLGFMVPAAFTKSKKPGRREYLRARIDGEGRVEVFGSEGSGRISGLSWATGLVELPDAAVEVAPGVPVRFLPYSGFGI